VKFIDEAKVVVQSGKGGRGCVSFRREKFIPKGGPDGGDGGKGGNVIFIATTRKRTLYRFRHQKLLKAKNGQPGQGQGKHGKNGQDLIVEIPVGTLVMDAETGEIIKDFIHDEESFVVAYGGRGGRGNKRFATSRNQAPRFAQPGESGQTLVLVLELKLLAEVGIIGLPNAGKSTLISRISSARPKVGDYPFTTLTPNIGMVQAQWGEPFAVADIPGLVEGAHSGTGLGIKFLRHIERTRILLHLIDASAIDPEKPLEAYTTINHELARYSETLARKTQIVVLNKVDIPGVREKVQIIQDAIPDQNILVISAVTGEGVETLTSQLAAAIEEKA
jgi:GTP-binding protein